MSAEINIQFYSFDKECRAKPVEKLPEQHLAWQSVISLIKQIANCTIVVGKTEAQRIIVLLTDMRFLHDERTYSNLVEVADADESSPLRSIKNPDNQRNIEQALKRNCPIIMVGTEDIMDLYAEEEKEDKDARKQRKYQYSLDLDPRFKYWDSSIWQRYVPLDVRKSDGQTTFAKRFAEVFAQVKSWYDQGLYATFVALENLEFQTRLMLQSSIAAVGHHGHEARVTPFKFHSETQMALKARRIIATMEKYGLWENIKWNMLLVDDQGDKILSSFNKVCKKNKKILIEELLKQGIEQKEAIFDVTSLPDDKDKGYIEQALDHLKEKTYDVILLDYLLGTGNDDRNGREYGYDFLQKLEHSFEAHEGKDDGSPLHKGPLGRFWIFPVSSFPFAFADKLRQLGMDGYSDHWLLSGGGDPVCTPELFRFNFLNFVKQQITDCYLYPEAMFEFFNRYSNIENGILWRELTLESIEQVKLRKFVLENDEAQGSQFASSILSFIRNNIKYAKTLETLRTFVTNITDVPYFRIEDALSSIIDHENQNKSVVQILRDKSALFFKVEKELESEIENFSQNTFDFSGKRLRWLPKEIGTLPEGTNTLRLSNNQLTFVPPEIANLKKLQKLDLSYNHLEQLPIEISLLRELEYLNLIGNPQLPDYLRLKHEGRDEITYLFKNVATWQKERIKKVVLSYAHDDEDGAKHLEKLLKPMERDQKLIRFWMDSKILPGEKWDSDIKRHFMEADIILLLISSSFLASDYIYNVEMKIAMTRLKEKTCKIVPIIWRACDWKSNDDLKGLQFLPKDAKPIKKGDSTAQDEAWNNVVEGLRKLLFQGRFS